MIQGVKINTILTDKSVNGWVIALSVIYIILSAIVAYMGSLALSIIPLAIFVAYLAFFKLDWLMFGLVAFVPLSIQLRFIVPGLPFDLFLPTEPLIISILILFIYRWIHIGGFDAKILTHPIAIAAWIYIGWLIVAASASSMPIVSIKYILSRSWYFFVFFLIASQLFRKRPNIQLYVWLYTIALVIVIAYTIARMAGAGLANHQFANKSCWPFYNDHTSYGAALVMVLPVLFGFFIANKKASNTQRFFHIVVILIYFAAIIFSYTRAAWLALIVACGIGLLVHWRIKFRTILLVAGILVAIIFSFRTQIYFFLNDNHQDSASDLKKHLQSAYNVKTDASNVERINRWNCAIRMFKERPVFGYGPGTYQFQYAPFQHFRERTIISTDFGTGGNAHSEYLGTLSESGLPGMLAIMWIFVSVFLTGVRVYRKSTDRRLRIVTMSLLLGLITYIFHAYLNNFLDTDKIGALFWGFAAILAAYEIYYIPYEKKKEELTIQ